MGNNCQCYQLYHCGFIYIPVVHLSPWFLNVLQKLKIFKQLISLDIVATRNEIYPTQQTNNDNLHVSTSSTINKPCNTPLISYNYYIHMFMIPPLKLMIITRQAMKLVVHTDNG